jgi:uncharacterized membrane protein YbaN (DUF454 family)
MDWYEASMRMAGLTAKLAGGIGVALALLAYTVVLFPYHVAMAVSHARYSRRLAAVVLSDPRYASAAQAQACRAAAQATLQRLAREN